MKTKLLLAAMIVALATSISHAQSVSWGTSVSTNPLSYTSDGTVDNATLTWEIGWFTDGYTPTATNWSSWMDNFHAVDYSSEGSFGDRAHMNYDGLWTLSVNTADVGAEAYGKQAYIFAYNDSSLFGTSEGEALLMRQDGLNFPDTLNQITFDIADNPNETADNGFTVVWGRVDRDMYNSGGVVEGGGQYTNLVADSASQPYDSINGTFEVQSATWTVAPEPSTSCLILLGSMVVILHRKR